MLDFLHKNKPLFWRNYLKLFKQKRVQTIAETHFIIFDTETTGLDFKTNCILSIGAVSLKNNIIDVAQGFEIYLQQDKFNHESVKIHGILKEGNYKKLTEKEAIEAFINYIGNAVLVAHHAAFDIKMINIALKRMKLGTLKNKVIDTGILYKKLAGKKNNHFNLDVLCKEFNIHTNDRHTAAGDAFITAQLFLKILSKLKQERQIHYSDLFRNSEKHGLI